MSDRKCNIEFKSIETPLGYIMSGRGAVYIDSLEQKNNILIFKGEINSRFCLPEYQKYKWYSYQLILKNVKVYDYITENGKQRAVLNEKETILAQDKQNLIILKNVKVYKCENIEVYAWKEWNCNSPFSEVINSEWHKEYKIDNNVYKHLIIETYDFIYFVLCKGFEMRKARTLASVHGTMTALAESPVLCVTGIPVSIYMTSRAI